MCQRRLCKLRLGKMPGNIKHLLNIGFYYYCLFPQTSSTLHYSLPSYTSICTPNNRVKEQLHFSFFSLQEANYLSNSITLHMQQVEKNIHCLPQNLKICDRSPERSLCLCKLSLLTSYPCLFQRRLSYIQMWEHYIQNKWLKKKNTWMRSEQIKWGQGWYQWREKKTNNNNNKNQAALSYSLVSSRSHSAI